MPSRNGFPQSFACKPKDWGCANFGADNARKVKMSNDVQDVLNYTGSTLATLHCMISGLTKQLSEASGPAAVEAAKQHAIKAAKAYPSNPDIAPDIPGIEAFFNSYK